jgi:exopolyphosphatase/guanosine-5'-triphosphate,3'-diphosphate pyrophosphatase
MAIFSSIDIGTNSTRLLITNSTDDHSLHPLVMEERITRLGKGLKSERALTSEALFRVSEVLKEYKEIIMSYKGNLPYVIATSAAREASNKDDLIKIIRNTTGSSCHIISGEEEALLNFLGVMSDLSRKYDSVVIIDVGGGSTEFIVVKNDHIVSKKSLPIGSRRLSESFFHHDPVTDKEVRDFLSHTTSILLSHCNPLEINASTCIMVGGTVTTLAMVDIGNTAFNYEEVHLHELSLNSTSEMVEIFSEKTVQERTGIRGLHPQRADIILAGTLIVEAILKHLGFSSFIISVRDLLFGILIKKTLKKH